MAEEALDIKSLTTLMMTTPKTDVTQAVGRILRSKEHKPLVIDIVDVHDIFQRQWLKRKKFYLSNKYKIMYSTNYKSNQWEIIESNKKQKNTSYVSQKNKKSKITGVSILDAFD
jgi:superfamily II DNA or RNA helicase